MMSPATVVCDYMSYVFMFLSVATSNMVATALTKQGFPISYRVVQQG
ncbi:Protein DETOXIFICATION 47, chloroplastic [Orobanche gracilis]